MSTSRDRAEELFRALTKEEPNESAFLAERRAREAANLQKTRELKAARLAHAAAAPAKTARRRAKAQPTET